MKKRILLMYSPGSSGHQQAAMAIQAAIREIRPESEVLTIDLFNYSSPILEKMIVKVYLGLLKTMPRVWGYLYDNHRVLSMVSWFMAMSYRMSSNKAKAIFEDFQPQAIVCTQAFPCGVMADYKKRFSSNFLLVGVLTDYLPHSYWVSEEVDRYVVSSLQARQYLARSGITEDKIINYGIPVHPKFRCRNNQRQILIKKLGLDPGMPIILIMGGCHGAGPIEKTVYQLGKIGLDFQIIVITGINTSLKNRLEKKKGYFKKPVRILGYADNIDQIMEISTLVITKPGGVTCAEALAKKLPIVILKPIPGQETNNTRFLIEQGAGVGVNSQEKVAAVVSRLLKEPDELDRMRRNSREISNPDSALKIARLALEG
ncbi:MAG: glycosyltransferase [Candidatus Omnitrophota bacterium]|nr:glycosyltransferase [Candidatus Omnitrophota bacterium]